MVQTKTVNDEPVVVALYAQVSIARRLSVLTPAGAQESAYLMVPLIRRRCLRGFELPNRSRADDKASGNILEAALGQFLTS
jgi:hypothetical protein